LYVVHHDAQVLKLVIVDLCGLFVWLVADGWCWFVLREKYCWLVAGGWFFLREKYCWLVADKPSERGGDLEHYYDTEKSEVFSRSRGHHICSFKKK
jgi:hypothetical protein